MLHLSMGAMTLVLFLFSLTVGAVEIPLADVIAILAAKLGLAVRTVDEVQAVVLTEIRLPRLLQTVLIGAALGTGGAALQGLFRNPLVEPGIIGVSGGAALGAVGVILLGNALFMGLVPWLGNLLLPFAAFVGALLATVMVHRLATHQGRTHITVLVLSGVAVNALAGALLGFAIFYADDQQLRTFTFWSLGDLGGATWDTLLLSGPMIGLPVAYLLSLQKPLDALALGEAEAFHSGINVERLKSVAIVLTAVAVGTAVAFAGIIGFVGLVIPHLVRMAAGPAHRYVLPGSALGGASLLLAADLFARTAIAPAELPIGIVTALAGTPFFIGLLVSSKKKNML